MLLRLCYLLIVLAAFWVQPAGAVFYTYAQWVALPESQQAAYMSGAFDSLVTFANTPKVQGEACTITPAWRSPV